MYNKNVFRKHLKQLVRYQHFFLEIGWILVSWHVAVRPSPPSNTSVLYDCVKGLIPFISTVGHLTPGLVLTLNFTLHNCCLCVMWAVTLDLVLIPQTCQSAKVTPPRLPVVLTMEKLLFKLWQSMKHEYKGSEIGEAAAVPSRWSAGRHWWGLTVRDCPLLCMAGVNGLRPVVSVNILLCRGSRPLVIWNWGGHTVSQVIH